jgi:oxaloacetate decarboxylase alpha subunit/pyruvate carboxylase subunit B
MADIDSYKLYPLDFDIAVGTLPKRIDTLFDKAIELAKAEKEAELIAVCQKIEKYFNFPPPDELVKNAEIPGGMYTNMLSQLKGLKLEKLLPRTLEIIPTVRLAAGCPPLVTPTSQIIGVQAVNCVIDENKGQPFYTTKSIQFVNLVKGLYGRTPVPVDPEFRYKIAGVHEETPYDTRNYRKQENPFYPEYGDVHLAQNEKEQLLLELFPSVAYDFLKKRMIDKYLNEIHEIEEIKRKKHLKEKEKYEILTPEEKLQRLMDGLYNY